MMRSLSAWAICAVLLTGCTVLAGKGDYAAYRATRLVDNERDRVMALKSYMQAHPDGVWARDVQRERIRLEPQFWEEGRTTLEGLTSYLEAFPDGPHSAEARPRLAALQAVAGNVQEEQAHDQQVIGERRDEQNEQRRTWMTRSSGFWTRTLLSVTNWGSPIAAVARENADFSSAFGNDPRPRCSADECIKFYRSDFGIPVPGSTRIERSLQLLLRLRMRQGNVQRAELLMPNKGFSRWFEQENRTIVTDEDPGQRQQAIDWALERLIPAIREAAPNAQAVFDVVPEPIDAPAVVAPGQPQPGASRAPGDEPELERPANRPEPTPEQPRPAPRTQQRGELDDLIQRAAPDDPQEPQAQPEPQAAPVAQESMVLPIALQGFRVGQIRLVIFAASEDDYGLAYDGLFIENVAEGAAPPPRRRGRRGRRR